MKKLSICITHYNEDWLQVQPMLSSIAMQRSIDFDDIEVIIVNDGEWATPPLFVYAQPYEVRYIINEKKTVSAARNRALDEAQGEYVMICDCDDMFYSATALYIIFNEMAIGFDGLVDNFIEESKHPETGQRLYIDHQGTDLFVHGKVWRKQYLIDNNIRFRDDLSIHEESPFTFVAMNCSENVKLCPVPYYLWCWNDNSVCRRDPKYILKTYNNMIESQTAVAEEFIKRNMVDKAKGFVVGMFFDTYYSLCSKDWKDIGNAEYREAVEKRFREYVDDFRYLWDDVSEQDKLIISNGIRQQKIAQGQLEMENVTFEEFLKRFE